jgi:predicted O-methyltransferase YrrM
LALRSEFGKATAARNFYLVDPWPKRDDQYELVKTRFAKQRATIHRMTSARFFSTFTTQVDWVYIDGLHDYDHVLADLYGAENILKPGGVIYGDDYGKKGGVQDAVEQYCAARSFPLDMLGLNQYAIATSAEVYLVAA